MITPPLPEYCIQLRASCRPGNSHEDPKVGTSWTLDHNFPDGRHEVLFTSYEVFDDEDDAKRDAVKKLKPLICCHESPLNRAVKTLVDWMTDEAP